MLSYHMTTESPEAPSGQLWHQWPEEPEEDFALFGSWLEDGCLPLGSWQKTHPDRPRVAALSVASLYAKSGRWDWRPRSSAYLAWRRRVDQEAVSVAASEWAARTSRLMALYEELLTESLQAALESGNTLKSKDLIAGLKEFVVATRLLAGQSTENHSHALLTQSIEAATEEEMIALHSLLKSMGSGK